MNDHRYQIFDEVNRERENQIAIGFGGDTDKFDRANSRNDWIAYITNYAGDAATTARNKRAGRDFREHMVKVAALAVAAIEAHDAAEN